MTLETETVETLEPSALQLTPAERARVLDRLIATLDVDPEVEEAGQRKGNVGKPKSKMEPLLYFPAPKPSPN